MITHPYAYDDVQGIIGTSLAGASQWTTEQIRDGSANEYSD